MERQKEVEKDSPVLNTDSKFKQQMKEIASVNPEAAEKFEDWLKVNIFSPQIQLFEPFAGHVDPSRTNMSSKQLLQTTTSRMNDIPFIFNKYYQEFTSVKSNFVLRAPEDGMVLYNEDDILFIFYKNENNKEGRLAVEYIPKTKKLTNNALVLRHIREVGSFKKGDLLFDYTGQTEEGIPRIGYRTNIMFSSFFGFTAEDAFVCSESYSRRAQIDYTAKLYVPITKKFKYKKNSKKQYFTKVGERTDEKFMKYIKIDSDMHYNSEIINISEEESQHYLNTIDGLDDAEVTSIKVHKLDSKDFSSRAADYVYSPELIREISYLYNDQYQMYTKLLSEFGKTINNSEQLVTHIMTKYFLNNKLPSKIIEDCALEYDLVPSDIDYIIEVDLLQTVASAVGDKFANCFAGKGVISLIIPDKFMPPGVDVIFNPLGIYGRNNWGTMFELGSSEIILDVQKTIEDKELTIKKLEHIHEKFIKATDMDYYDRVQLLLEAIKVPHSLEWMEFKQSVINHGFYLHADTIPGFAFADFFNLYVDTYREKFGIEVEKKDFTITKELMTWLVEERGYTSPTIDIENWEDVTSQSYFGQMYYLKLFHTANSKFNSVALARSYNKANGQPPRGRKLDGGCHVSWQTLAAGNGHSANSDIIRELWTVKSDCIEDKAQFLDQLIYTGQTHLKESGYKSKTMTHLNHILALYGMQFQWVDDVQESCRATEEILQAEEKKRMEEYAQLSNRSSNGSSIKKVEEMFKSSGDQLIYEADDDLKTLQDQHSEQEFLLKIFNRNN